MNKTEQRQTEAVNACFDAHLGAAAGARPVCIAADVTAGATLWLAMLGTPALVIVKDMVMGATVLEGAAVVLTPLDVAMLEGAAVAITPLDVAIPVGVDPAV